ncbi:MAG TPA: tRNA preQ1(34) S-adenosylmethionine ribosyltransferase-isomerase QueA [Vicinamibacterales bacterium]
MRVSDFDFPLPPELIAQTPAPRGTSRLLVLDRATGAVTHQHIGDLPAWLRAGDLLVVNDTRVFPARLLGHRVPSGGRVEVMLIEQKAPDLWDALVHPGQKLKPGARVRLEGQSEGGAQGTLPVIEGEIVGRASFGRRTIRLSTTSGTIDEAIDAIGHVPLPPYIARPDSDADRERYQTIYARARGSVAAPTAGLHFTPALLDRLASHGVERVSITLHVGYGTFKPVRVEDVEEHTVDPERFTIGADAASRIMQARDAGRRIVAVGTTTVRALESAGRSGRMVAGEGVTDLFIHPGGHRIAWVDALLTNFHLPRSSLLMLVCAFAGREKVLRAYHEAVAEGYRFYSYGDAMLIV